MAAPKCLAPNGLAYPLRFCFSQRVGSSSLRVAFSTGWARLPIAKKIPEDFPCATRLSRETAGNSLGYPPDAVCYLHLSISEHPIHEIQRSIAFLGSPSGLGRNGALSSNLGLPS